MRRKTSKALQRAGACWFQSPTQRISSATVTRCTVSMVVLVGLVPIAGKTRLGRRAPAGAPASSATLTVKLHKRLVVACLFVVGVVIAVLCVVIDMVIIIVFVMLVSQNYSTFQFTEGCPPQAPGSHDQQGCKGEM